jgi:hypothetical protein
MLNFKRLIDEQLFGEAIKTPDSLYFFVDDQISRLLRSSYRKNFKDIHVYRTYNDDWWEDDSDTSYLLYKNIYDTGKLIIPYVINSAYPQSIVNESDIISKLKVFVDDEIYELEKESCSGKKYLKADKENKCLKTNYDVSFHIINEEDERKYEYSFNIPIDDLMLSNKDHVRVRILSKSLQHKSDKNHSLRVHYPTKDVFLSCAFQDSELRLVGRAFGFNTQNHITKEQKNYAFVDVKEWMIPGHGAIISWQYIQEK